MLDGLEEPKCHFCGEPARMPEDCVAIKQSKGKMIPLFMCQNEECENKLISIITDD